MFLKKTIIFFQILTLTFLCFALILLTSCGKTTTATKSSSSVNFPFQLKKQEAIGLTLINVSYKDFNNQLKKGHLEVPNDPKVIKAVEGLFQDLLTKNFLIEKLNPYSQYQDFYKALNENASFGFEDQFSNYLLIINPVINPLILRPSQKSPLKNILPADQGHFFNDMAIPIVIFPQRGVLSVNRNQTSEHGKVDGDALKIFNRYQFDRPPFDNGGLFFGGFQYQASASDQTSHPKTPSLSKLDSPPPFKYGPLPDSIKKSLIKSGTWKPGCPVSLERLAYVQFGYYDFQLNEKIGALVTADVVAPEILEIFKNFYQKKVSVEKPGGDKVGGTGMFNCRPITGGGGYSLHSYGTALDLSYYRNPYIGEYNIHSNENYASAVIIPPSSSLTFLVRDKKINGFNEEHVNFLRSQGLSEWGGNWINRTDYMHFQTSPFFSYLFPLIGYESGRKIFTLEKNLDNVLHQFSIEVTEMTKWKLLAEIYSDFADVFVENIAIFSQSGEDAFYKKLIDQLQK